MPIIESKSPMKADYKKSVVFKSVFIRSPEMLVFPKSICKILDYKAGQLDGYDFFKVDIPQWLFSKMVQDYDLHDYGFEIMME